MALTNERYVAYLADEDLNHIQQLPDLLYLEMTWVHNSPGSITMRLPEKYCDQLQELGLMDPNAECMPKFFIMVYHVSGNKCCLWENMAWLIDRPLTVQKPNGDCYVQLEANSADELLTYRSIFAPREEDDDGNNTNQYTNHTGPADTVMCEIFEDQFGDDADLDAAKAPAVRDWITAGCVKIGEKPDPPCGAECQPRLDYRGTLLDIFKECANASAALGQPLCFELVPTITNGPYGQEASLPLCFNIYCDHRGEDRSVGNTGGNDPIILSETNGSIAAFTQGPDYGADFSVAMTAGLDDEGNIPISILCDVDRSNCGKWGWKEALNVDKDAVDQGQVDSANAAFLEEGRKSGAIVIEFANSPAVCYGDPECVGGDFSGGDCVTVEIKCVQSKVLVDSVNVKCDNGKITYRLKFSRVESSVVV